MATAEPRVTWDAEGRPTWIHWCSSAWGGEGDDVHVQLPVGSRGWSVDRAADTVSPSLLCLGCRTHGFWTRGKWVSA